jgi:hypothetical protein
VSKLNFTLSLKTQMLCRRDSDNTMASHGDQSSPN